MPLAEVLSQPFVADRLPPLLERHQKSIALIRQRAEERNGTIFFDLTDLPLDGYNKFILTISIPRPLILLASRNPASAPRSRLVRIPGPRPTRPRW